VVRRTQVPSSSGLMMMIVLMPHSCRAGCMLMLCTAYYRPVTQRLLNHLRAQGTFNAATHLEWADRGAI
jgi:hypothetical protein